MPLSHTCIEHPGFSGDVFEEVLEHVAAGHPGTTMTDLRATGVLVTRYSDQSAAQGHADAIRIFGCRRCGVRVEQRGRVDSPYCDECKGDVA